MELTGNINLFRNMRETVEFSPIAVEQQERGDAGNRTDRTAEAELIALGNAVADKIVHQLRGTHSDVQPLLAASAALPNAEEIGRLIDQTMSGPSDELLPLL